MRTMIRVPAGTVTVCDAPGCGAVAAGVLTASRSTPTTASQRLNRIFRFIDLASRHVAKRRFFSGLDLYPLYTQWGWVGRKKVSPCKSHSRECRARDQHARSRRPQDAGAAALGLMRLGCPTSPPNAASASSRFTDQRETDRGHDKLGVVLEAMDRCENRKSRSGPNKKHT